MSTQENGQTVRDGLIQVQIDLRDVRFRQRSCPRIRDDADNSNPGRLCSSRLEASAQGVFARPVRARERFIDHRHLWGLAAVQLVEQAAAQQGNSQQVKIAWRNARPFNHRRLVTLNVASFDGKEEVAFGDHV